MSLPHYTWEVTLERENPADSATLIARGITYTGAVSDAYRRLTEARGYYIGLYDVVALTRKEIYSDACIV